jgi:hypothetical protein
MTLPPSFSRTVEDDKNIKPATYFISWLHRPEFITPYENRCIGQNGKRGSFLSHAQVTPAKRATSEACTPFCFLWSLSCMSPLIKRGTQRIFKKTAVHECRIYSFLISFISLIHDRPKSCNKAFWYALIFLALFYNTVFFRY